MNARTLFGAGSMLAVMCEAFRRNNPTGQLWAVPLDDAASAAQGTETITVSSASTAAGTISLYIAGRRIAVGITGATTTADIAAAINTAIVNAGGGGNRRTAGQFRGLRLGCDAYQPQRRYGQRHRRAPFLPTDEALPPGVALDIAQGTAGATDPDISAALDTVVDERFNVIGHPYTGAAMMSALETELGARWGPTRQHDGEAVTAYRGTAAAATTYGNARNSPYSCVMGISTSPSSVPQWAGALAGRVALSAASDPALPFTTIPLRGILPAPLANRFSHAERETLLSDGIATHTVDRAGVVSIERMVTTYQTATGGVPDAAYRDANTLFTVSFLRASLRSRIATKFSRYKLANDGTRFLTRPTCRHAFDGARRHHRALPPMGACGAGRKCRCFQGEPGR